MNPLHGMRARANLVYLGFVALGLAVAFKLFSIQLAEGEHWRAKAEEMAYAYREVRPERGHILSDDDRLLATSLPVYAVYMDPSCPALTDAVFSAGIDSLSRGIAAILGDRTAEACKRDLLDARRRGARYHSIKRRVKHDQLVRMKALPIFKEGRYGGGFIVEARTERMLPNGRLAKRTIGYANDDTTRTYPGIEGGYDKWLRGVTGRRWERRLAGNVWMPLDDGRGVAPVSGSDIHTTIDVHLQDVADAALERQMREHGAKNGCVVVMEVATGYIKAVSNLTWNPDSARYEESLNHAFTVPVEPGSTFKLPILMAALEDGLINLGDTLDTRGGRVLFHGKKLEDSHQGGHGRITLRRAFQLSSNTAISKAIDAAYKRNPQDLLNGLRRMGLGGPTGIRIPGEPPPTLHAPGDREWSLISVPWMSVGYGVEYTPLQILAFYNAVANNGRLMRPQLVRRITRHGRTVEEFPPETVTERICSERTLVAARELLRSVVDSGTAENLRYAHLPIAGKTGTAVITQDGRYDGPRKIYRASFAGYFPADKPLYSCIVVVTDPSVGSVYGNKVAGPVFREIADKLLANRFDPPSPAHAVASREPATTARVVPVTHAGHAGDLRTALAQLGIAHVDHADGDWVNTRATDSAVVITPRTLPGTGMGLVPDVTGMGLRDALYLLETHGLKVRVQGSGMVRKQSMQPGSRALPGATILIELT